MKIEIVIIYKKNHEIVVFIFPKKLKNKNFLEYNFT